MGVTTLMQRAIGLAIDNVRSGRGGPFGCVIARGGEIVSESANQVTATTDPTAHAEIVAIRKAALALGTFDLAGCELYTSCEPCPMCMGAIYWAHLDRVFYAASADDATAAGFDDRRIYQELAKSPSERSIPMINLMRDESLAAFEAWCQSQSRIPY